MTQTTSQIAPTTQHHEQQHTLCSQLSSGLQVAKEAYRGAGPSLDLSAGAMVTARPGHAWQAVGSRNVYLREIKGSSSLATSTTIQ